MGQAEGPGRGRAQLNQAAAGGGGVAEVGGAGGARALRERPDCVGPNGPLGDCGFYPWMQ